MGKKYIAFALLPVFALALLAGGITYASANSTDNKNPFNKIATAIATKFNLNATDVQTVIDDTMKAELAEMEKNRPDRLAQAVTDGKLTQAQADLIKAKQEEVKTTMESQKDTTKNMTQAEREAAMKTQTETLKQWVTDNNIPKEYIMFLGKPGKGPGGDRGMGGSMHARNNAPTTETQTAAE
jgi:hypothetical protein